MGFAGPAAWFTLHFLLLHFDLCVKEKYSKGLSSGNRKVRPEWLNEGNLNPGLRELLEVCLGNLIVSNHLVNGGERGDLGKAAAPEFAGIAHHHGPPRDFDHLVIHL